MSSQQKIVLGVIVGNRNFFPDSLISQGRQDVLDVLREQNIDAVILDERATKLGAVEHELDADEDGKPDQHCQQTIFGDCYIAEDEGAAVL